MMSMASVIVYITGLMVSAGLSDVTDALKEGVKEAGKEILQEQQCSQPRQPSQPAPEERTINSVINVIDAGKKMIENRLGPVEEFYLGRAVSAQVLGAYPKRLTQDSPVTQYVSRVGSTLALASRAPYPYRPYTFVVLDASEINAFAAPGGIIFVTTGMLRFLDSEDALAGVLGHEIGHMELRHGVRTLEQEGIINFAGTTANAAAQEAGDNGADSEIVRQFTDEVVGEIFNGVRNGYSVKLEAEADERSLEICYHAGYDPKALVQVLRRFKETTSSYGGAQYSKDREDRALGVLQRLPGAAAVSPLSARTERYQSTLMMLN